MIIRKIKHQIVTIDRSDGLSREVLSTLSPRHHKLLNTGWSLRHHVTKTGRIQWRTFTKDVADTNEQEPMKSEVTTVTPEQKAYARFMKMARDKKPTALKISDKKWDYLMRSIYRNKNIMMVGPSGSGKTYTIQMASSALDKRSFFSFNLGATTDARSTLIGNTHYQKDKGTFVAEALFVKAIQCKDAIILLDEITRASPDAWNILLTVLDERQRYLRIDEHPDTPTIKVAKGVTFMATANIGAEYTSTRVMDRALMDRFAAIIEMEPLQLDEELDLLKTLYPRADVNILTSICDIAQYTREQVLSDDSRISTILSTRQTMEMAGLVEDGFSLADVAEVCVYPLYSKSGGVESERTFMKQLVQKYLFDGGAA